MKMDLKISNNFLIQLRKNNNRDWFKTNKALYVEAKKQFDQLTEVLILVIKDIDSEIDVTSAKECTFRIFRDVRFSKNKSPYKTNFGAYIAKGGRKGPFAGFYIHLEPNESFVGGGVYMPESKNLKAIRTAIFENIDNYKEIINNKTFKKHFDGIYGEKLKLAPKGFPKDFADIDLLKNKHYTVIHKVDDTFWTSENLIEYLSKIFKIQFPFNKFINKAIRSNIS